MGANEQQQMSEPILRGRLEEIEVGSLLAALRLGRQHFTLELYDAAGDCTGVVAVKAGRIVSASVDGYTGNEAVRRLLENRESTEVRVLLQPTAAAAETDAEPLGTIVELTQTRSKGETRTRVMQGVLSEQLSVEDLLRGLAFTRQYVTLVLSDRGGHVLGEVAVKANKVLSARAGDLVALPALRQLRHAPAGSQFVVFAEKEHVVQLHTLGTVAEVLGRSKESSIDAATTTNGHGKTTSRSAQAIQATFAEGRIVEGSLDDFELSHLLRVLSTSRQHFEIHIHDESAQPVGVIELKSGMIVAAATGKLTGVSAARELLQTQTGRFVAIRRSDRTLERPALLSVSAFLKPSAAGLEETQPQTSSHTVELNAPDNAGAKPILVMDGKLGEFDVPSILHIVGASRQYTCVQILDDQRAPLGVIHVKSGQLVRAQAQDVTGVEALRRLLHCPSDFSFLVQRYPNALEATTSLGSIPDMLMRAATPPAPAVATPTASASSRRDAPNSTWIGGAAVGAGLVLLGGIASALVMRPAELTTSISPISSPPHVLAPVRTEIAQQPSPPREAAPVPTEPANPATQADTPIADAARTPFQAAPSRATIAGLQAGLHQLGYETGPIDGIIGPRTAAAIRAFQYAEHLTVDGTLSAPTRAVLLRRIDEP